MSLLDPSQTFAELAKSVGLDNRLLKAVQRLGHTRPTLVQSKSISLATSSGRDLLVRARTGTGKTLAYLLPLLQKILQSKASAPKGHAPGVRALVLVPTRELCAQVTKALESLLYYCDEECSAASLTTASGRGEKANQLLVKQKALLRDHPDVLVATPLGILTHIRNGDVDLKSSVETLVVDEADLIFSYGYADDVSEIMKALPKICQGFLMSATMSPELLSLKKVVLHSPVVIKLEEDESQNGPSQLAQFYLNCPKNDKNLVVYVFLKLGLLKGKGIFFVNSTDGGYKMKLFLEQFHIRAAVLNAELPFRSRLNIIEQFNVDSFDYLIATDDSVQVNNRNSDGEDTDEDDKPEKMKGRRQKDDEYGVSRGLDFRNVSFVLNVDFPTTPESYSHRIGRTARGGAKGVALSFVEKGNQEQEDRLAAVQEDQPTIPITGAVTDTLRGATNEDDPSGQSSDQRQPTPLDFQLKEIEGFRYRVEDVSRAVTRKAVKESRAAELRAEMLNSERLQAHFDDNPNDLNLLRHDRIVSRPSSVQDHLKHVPKYLLPRGMQAANLNRKRKRRKGNKNRDQLGSNSDPLFSFNDESGLEGLGAREDGEGTPADSSRPESEPKIYSSSRDGVGKSTAGRQQWKERHKKGRFSGKTRVSSSKGKRFKAPMGF